MRKPILPHRISALVVICLLAGSAPAAFGKSHINDILAKGSVWTLNVDGEEAKMILVGGKGGQTPGGGFEVSYEVEWGSQKGSLSGVADAKNMSQRVTLELTRKNGIKVNCRGFIAQETDQFMAGTCGRTAPGAFYATKQSASFVTAVQEGEQKYTACMDRLRVSRRNGTQAVQERDRARRQLSATTNRLDSCRSQLSNAGSGAQTRPYSSYRNRLDGRYETGGKTDQVTELKFPGSPGATSDLGKWLAAHNSALLVVVDGILRPGDRNGFRALEQQRCGNNDYCRAGIREQAIACGLGIGC